MNRIFSEVFVPICFHLLSISSCTSHSTDVNSLDQL
ncbi:hypothetical protein X975_06031, partial [Stegodyphus mimosarum]